MRTPSGGFHVWYRVADHCHWQPSVGTSPGRALAWQVDIRAHGSYIVSPGNLADAGPVPRRRHQTERSEGGTPLQAMRQLGIMLPL
ncbi:bifunctional DNA primase/polymerase [Streptomyces sp. NPDC057428]|uniref:bifunctional DNA primase/polymerase n=1 Tax=Streptomyces sp. NPDC057428 TaxID=3346129 RepID=UPI0036C7E3F1